MRFNHGQIIFETEEEKQLAVANVMSEIEWLRERFGTADTRPRIPPNPTEFRRVPSRKAAAELSI